MSSVLDSVIRAQQAVNQRNLIKQQIAQNQMRMQQMEALAPLQRRLSELEIERGQQSLETGRMQQQALGRQEQLDRTVLFGRLADQALGLAPGDERNNFILNAAQQLGIQEQFDPNDITQEDLENYSAIGRLMNPQTPKIGRFKGSVIGNKFVLLDSTTGEQKVSDLGGGVIRPPGMSDEDYASFKTLDPKSQSDLIKKQLDPKTKIEMQDREKSIKSGDEYRRTALSLVSNIKNAKKLDDVLGSVEGKFDFRFDSGEADIIADIKELESILTSDSLSLLSGVISDSDILFLKNIAAGGLDRTRSPKQFTKRLNDIESKLMAKVSGSSKGEGLEPAVSQPGRFTIEVVQSCLNTS